jgi:plasmid stabilization system protein ParE
MTYEVVWTETAENQLADFWTGAADQAAVTRAADRIDALLGYDAPRMGEQRPGGRRVLIEEPLAAFYEVIEDDRRVRVLYLVYRQPRS